MKYALVSAIVLLSGLRLSRAYFTQEHLKQLLQRTRTALFAEDIQQIKQCELELIDVLADEMACFLSGRSSIRLVTFDFVRILSAIYDALVELKSRRATDAGTPSSVYLSSSGSPYARICHDLLMREHVSTLFDEPEHATGKQEFPGDLLTKIFDAKVGLFIINEDFLINQRCLRELLIFEAKERKLRRTGNLHPNDDSNLIFVIERGPELADRIRQSLIGQALEWPTMKVCKYDEDALTHILFQVLPSVRHILNGKRAKSFLLKYNAMFVDEEYDVPTAKCVQFHPGTRDDILLDMTTLESNHSIALLVGEMDFGKSVIMAEIVRRGNQVFRGKLEGRLRESIVEDVDVVAFHFFNPASSRLMSCKAAIISLALQLCSNFAQFDEALYRSSLNMNFTKFIEHEFSPRILLKLLIIDPATAMPSQLMKPKAIVIDGLDECDRPREFMIALHDEWKKAPKWLMLKVSSRDVHLDNIRGDNVKEVRISPEQNERDVGIYVDHLVANVWRVSNKGEASNIASYLKERAQGQFLWISFLVQELEPFANNPGSLTYDAVMAKKHLKGMDETYSKYFSALKKKFPTNDEYRRAVARAILVPQDPIPETVWRKAIGYGEMTDECNSNYRKVRDAAKTLLLFTDNGNVQAPHPSMRVWLQQSLDEFTDDAVKDEVVDLIVTDVTPLHSEIASILEEIIEKLNASRPLHVMGDYNDEESYALRNVVHHWIQGGEKDKAIEWYVRLDRLIRLLDQAQIDGDIRRVTEEGRQIRNLESNCLDSNNESTLNVCIEILELSIRSLERDVRMLPGQILGRSGIPPFDVARQPLVDEAQAWLNKMKV